MRASACRLEGVAGVARVRVTRGCAGRTHRAGASPCASPSEARRAGPLRPRRAVVAARARPDTTTPS